MLMALVKATRRFTMCSKLPTIIRGFRACSNVAQGRQLIHVAKQKVISLGSALKDDQHYLLSRLNRLSVSPWELNTSLEYVLPTLSHNSTVKKDTILPSTAKTGLDCPTLINLIPLSNPNLVKSITDPMTKVEIIDPKNVVEKVAKNILKIRRRKMNRHHLKKLRKRMKFVYRKRRHRKLKLKEAKVQAEFRAMMKKAEDFDAETWAKENLELARKGGFRLDIFASNSNK